MNLIESIWFLVSFLLILITLIVDPKELNSSINAFSDSSSEEQSIVIFIASLIVVFLVVTIGLSLNS
jgi:preprotein translocase subunit SecG